ncbi:MULTISPECIES: HAMP domain-containing methyl-accepting chemotaxis protein [Rhodopseudomonas]|uniref:Chemotaxis protein n=1 Tax=Rhodopseudomonas palustris TaxID=1076 RepID=A0A0D7EY58_RHOPL|nr:MULTISPECIES: HAMP domain-containing methyl-accepting chemotaxis protein [Rhodopseudomonas]KIZ45764.1 chemotaxis protein [Rhodopseudomonas palustris]MDF3812282.1 HAMP domain-containing methyl-accepting chemotaxis protein [Rhodopseudomonas sp. BAL398]WOK18270.1 HAMP domain-containing methyl-accepting chemotaxis protein [Rhodopseudomonas sp. BAL398]
MRLNSIGIKLGLASLVSIVLSLAMAGNQMLTERAINVANQHANAQQEVADHGLEANIGLRRMQLAGRDIRLASTAPDIEKAIGDLQQAHALVKQDIATAVSNVANSQDKQQFATISSLAADYIGQVTELAALQGSTATGEQLQAEHKKRDQIDARALALMSNALSLMRTTVDAAKRAADSAKDQAATQLSQANRLNFALGMAVMLSLFASMIFNFVGTSRPLMKLNGALGKMAAGELSVDVPGAGRGDEIGDIAKTVTVIRENADRKAREEAASKAEREQARALQRREDMNRLADDFEGAVGKIVEAVSAASAELEASAATLAATAEQSQKLTVVVAGASEEATSNVQSVASATEEMASSIHEIGRQVQDSARIAGAAVQQADKTNGRINQLAAAASRIGDVVELINTIAGQTNLLALNATIEAARAGDAGRGFAVVASEVKALAEQTAKATDEISQQITGMQAATDESVAAIKEIGTTISQMSEISSAIASAVEQQGAATQEISRNVQQAAQGTMQVSANIADVERGASETGSASSQLLNSAKSLSTDSSKLKTEVVKFLDSVRAA